MKLLGIITLSQSYRSAVWIQSEGQPLEAPLVERNPDFDGLGSAPDFQEGLRSLLMNQTFFPLEARFRL